MRTWQVDDVMSTDVAVVSPQTTYRDVVDVVTTRRVGAVPVVDAFGHVLGVISEADLLYKVELIGELHERRIFEGRRRRSAKVKADANTARDLMSSPAVTVYVTTPIVEAARTMDRENVKSLPVINLVGRLVGIVSRGDLLKVHLRPDTAIRRDIVEGIFQRTLGIDEQRVTVEVVNGSVRLAGALDERKSVETAGRLAANVSGVVSIVNDLTAKSEHSPLDGFPVGVA